VIYSHQFHHLNENDCATQVCITAAYNKQQNVKHCHLVACVHTLGNANTKCTITKFLNWWTFQKITYQSQKVLYSKDGTTLVVPVVAKKLKNYTRPFTVQSLVSLLVNLLFIVNMCLSRVTGLSSSHDTLHYS